MRAVVLVNPPNHREDLYDLSPPLSLLVLGQIAIDAGWDVRIVDLNLPPWPQLGDRPEVFYRDAVSAILKTGCEVVAFTSMAVNTHVAIELAIRLKRAQSSLFIVAGGVHFTSIATDVRKLFPAIDLIILGEGESQWMRCLQDLQRGLTPQPILAHDREVAPVILRHPFRAYHLVDLREYFRLNPRAVIDYEAGRGCVFQCSFCYSPSHYAAVRDVSPQQVVEELHQLASMGCRHVFMIQDNLLNSPQWAASLCEALYAEHLPVTWNCYATLPQLSSNVIRALGAASCREVYLGVDAISSAERVKFNKRFYRNYEQLETAIRRLLDNEIMPTCAVMVDLFNFDARDVEAALRVALACASAGAQIRINTFTRYPGSALQARGLPPRSSESKIRIALDCPEVVTNNRFSRNDPSLFPFHSTEEPDEDVWQLRLRAIAIAQLLIQQRSTSLKAFGEGDRTSMWDLFASLALDARVTGIEQLFEPERQKADKY